MICLVCGDDTGVREFGRIDPYTDYGCMVYHCAQCGSRFTPRDESIYESLHSNPQSSYSSHRDVAERAASAFRENDRRGLREMLAVSAKNRFVMDAIDALPESNLLEIGCSRGYLTSYFLLGGHRVLGSDVSETAVEGARQLFGDHFCRADSPLVDQRAPYDAIFHVGTIGCVESPIELTDRLLSLLAPGGLLLFNAPNVVAAEWQQLAWSRGTYPPDLVWLFHPGVWESRYGDRCDVEVTIERIPLGDSLGESRRRGVEVIATESLARSRSTVVSGDVVGGGSRGFSISGAVRAALNGISSIAPRWCRPTDFGMHVAMRRRESG